MPTAKLEVDWRRFRGETDRLVQLIDGMETLAVNHRKLVAEIVMIRLVLLAENAIASICMKLLCGAPYLDGTSPQIAVIAGSKVNAETLMREHGRKTPLRHLSWLRAKEIRKNLRFTLQQTDPLFGVLGRHSHILTEMMYVRNHIAHKSGSSLGHFQAVIRSRYGGSKRGVTPGVLLLTKALGTPILMEKYIGFYRVMVKELVRG